MRSRRQESKVPASGAHQRADGGAAIQEEQSNDSENELTPPEEGKAASHEDNWRMYYERYFGWVMDDNDEYHDFEPEPIRMIPEVYSFLKAMHASRLPRRQLGVLLEHTSTMVRALTQGATEIPQTEKSLNRLLCATTPSTQQLHPGIFIPPP